VKIEWEPNGGDRRIHGVYTLAGKPFCMHMAESREEIEFLQTGKGTWADLMFAAQIDFSGWKCFGNRPVELAFKQGLLDKDTLAVHVLEVTPREVELLAESRCGVCLCPRSNWTLHGKLPDMERFLKAGIHPALGTDSLASEALVSGSDLKVHFVEQDTNIQWRDHVI